MKLFLGCLLLSVAVGLGAVEFTQHQEMRFSFLLGSGLGLLNVGALYFSWKKLLEKKNLVLSGGVIVLKYPILGLLIYWAIKRPDVNAGWFLAGIGTVFPAALMSAIIWSIKSPKRNSEVSLKID